MKENMSLRYKGIKGKTPHTSQSKLCSYTVRKLDNLDDGCCSYDSKSTVRLHHRMRCPAWMTSKQTGQQSWCDSQCNQYNTEAKQDSMQGKVNTHQATRQTNMHIHSPRTNLSHSSIDCTCVYLYVPVSTLSVMRDQPLAWLGVQPPLA